MEYNNPSSVFQIWAISQVQNTVTEGTVTKPLTEIPTEPQKKYMALNPPVLFQKGLLCRKRNSHIEYTHIVHCGKGVTQLFQGLLDQGLSSHYDQRNLGVGV